MFFMVVIAISGRAGSGSSTIGRMLAKKLGLDFFSLGQYFKEIRSRTDKSNIDKTTKITKYFGTKEGSGIDIHNKLDKYQVEKAKKGNIVNEGKIAIFILKDLTDYKIWLTASDEKRAQRYCKREKISLKDSLNLIKKKDILEKKNFMDIYGIDHENQKNDANLIIDTSNRTPNEVIKIILKKITI